MLNSRTARQKESIENSSAVSFNAIDVVKFLCALLVVAIHIAPFNNEGPTILKNFNFGIQKYLSRIAVPFFFVCAGFFLFRKVENSEDKRSVIKQYCLKLIQLFGLWSIILVGNTSYQLWYIGASVVAIGLVCLLRKWNIKYRYMLLIAAILYILGLLGDSYYGLTEKLRQIKPVDYLDTTYQYFFINTRNGLFMGLPFILCGMLFAQGKIQINKVVALIGFLVSEIFLFCEVFLLKHFDIPKDYNMYIFLMPATVFLFAFVSKIKLKDRPIYKKLRVAGVLIYFSHLLVYKVLCFGVMVLQKKANVDLTVYLFWMTLFFAVGLAFLMEHLSRKKHFKWLKWLYS